jgi:hypothetical protein
VIEGWLYYPLALRKQANLQIVHLPSRKRVFLCNRPTAQRLRDCVVAPYVQLVFSFGRFGANAKGSVTLRGNFQRKLQT